VKVATARTISVGHQAIECILHTSFCPNLHKTHCLKQLTNQTAEDINVLDSYS